MVHKDKNAISAAKTFTKGRRILLKLKITHYVQKIRKYMIATKISRPSLAFPSFAVIDQQRPPLARMLKNFICKQPFKG